MLEVLKLFGMLPLQSGLFKFNIDSKKSKVYYYEVLINGKLVGFIDSSEIEEIKNKLRYLKALSTTPEASQNSLTQGIPKYMEICHVPKIELSNCNFSVYPGLYIFTSPGRMMRPVKNLTTNQTEFIGTMEQCYLHVCVKPEEFVEDVENFYNTFILI